MAEDQSKRRIINFDDLDNLYPALSSALEYMDGPVDEIEFADL